MTITGLLFSQKINDHYWIASRGIHNEIIHQNIQLYACIKPNNYIKKILALEKKVINQEYYLCSRKWTYIKYD